MADDGSGRIEQRNAAIALNAPSSKTGVSGEELADPFRMMRGLAVQDCVAWSASEGGFEVLQKVSASPHGARPKARTISRDSRQTRTRS